ncbi:MAG TPA: hypothetical protein VGN80_02925 [Devosiaceae bacterium]|nr:hypothetical protein [Devosiaceae bacterium]
MINIEEKRPSGPEAIEVGLGMLFDNLPDLAPENPAFSAATTEMAHRVGEAASFISARAFEVEVFVKDGQLSEVAKAMKTLVDFRDNY